MKLLRLLLPLPFLLLSVNQSWAGEILKLQKVTENVYSIVGPFDNRTPENFGNNATFGFVITSQGVVLIDAGGTYQGAKAIDLIIKSVTDKPVVKVINTGGQDHRWLGNGYFKQQGAEIIASKRSVEDQKTRKQDQLFMLGNLVGMKGLEGTNAVYADKTFDEKMEFVLGETTFQLYHAGQAHTPGDSFLWLPKQQVMFTGDIVYTQRLLGVLDHSNSKSWIETYQAMASYNPKFVIPGHGQPTTLDIAKNDTLDYLVFLRNAVSSFMQDGYDMSEISKVDQSKFSYLHSYEVLSGRNAQQVYSEMEWE